MIKPIREAIEAIDESEWVEIPYWLQGGADVAETTYTAFANTPEEITLRLIVRRARRPPAPNSRWT